MRNQDIQRKGGSGKNNRNPRKEEKENQYPKLVRIEYIDPLLVKNTDPRLYEPSLREVVGWLIDETDDEYVILICDKSKSYQPFERLHPEIAFVIPKNAILGIWDITSQSLRSWKNN